MFQREKLCFQINRYFSKLKAMFPSWKWGFQINDDVSKCIRVSKWI